MNSNRAYKLLNQLQRNYVGGWLIIDLIGYGKSAVVFKAARDNRERALKIFDPELVDRYGKITQLTPNQKRAISRW